MQNNKFNLPEKLKGLEDLAYNLWFSWNPDARDLFREIDVDLWRSCGRNPVQFLFDVQPETLTAKANDVSFVEKVNHTWQRYSDYLDNKKTHFAKNYPKMQDHLIAYFSAEYGIHESLPNYAGGLGILAGDHTKSASDLDLPFVAIGLMYKHAYFQQEIDESGNQVEKFIELNHNRLPVRQVLDANNKPLYAKVPLLDHEVSIIIWEAKVGRVTVFLLDTNVEQNSEEDRNIIHSLYGGSRDTRIRQEIILGIGGLRALREMGLDPTCFHMNEGHSAFLGLERLYELLNEGMDFKMALEYVRATTLFTTHTPIPAGNEAFEFEMIEKYFSNMWPKLEISNDNFLDLGRDKNIHQNEVFSLTVLALNLSSMANGVSKLHGEVSRKMWQKVWPGVPTHEIPIKHITNGIHTKTWLHRKMISLFDKHFGLDWREHIMESHFWDKIFEVPDKEYWDIMQQMKTEMSTHLRHYYKLRLNRYSEQNNNYPAAKELFHTDMLTIGFARRFAPYKRALLLFRDPERLKNILNNPKYPVQILFAGKAHPANQAGKDLITAINEYSRMDGFRGKIVFVEDYNMHIARALITGVDVWLNTPRRPLEASGTSGQKVTINGGINFSILDGWWIEGFDGQNGWAIGEDRHFDNPEEQDNIDSLSLYNILENEIVPLYYNQDKNGISSEWIKKSKMSLQSNISKFSSDRMVWEYLQKFYMPMMIRGERYAEEEYTKLYQFSAWKNRIQRHWDNVRLNLKNNETFDVDHRVLSAGENREIIITLNSGGLKASDLKLEITLQLQDVHNGYKQMKTFPMGLVKEDGNIFEYRANITAESDGTYLFNCRVFPIHQDLYNPNETHFIKWLD
jgi:glycogen phosphorylase